MASLSFATLDLPALFEAVSHVDAVMAPYYLVAHMTQVLVPGPLGLRLPSVLAATATAAIVGGIAHRWWGLWPALAAGVAFAVNPLAVTMSATARPYALATFFVALSALALDAALRRRTWWLWVAYAAAVAAAGTMHLFALLAIVPLVALAWGRWRAVGAWAAASAVGALAVIPVAVAAFGQRGQVSWIPRPDRRSAIGSIASVLFYQADGRLGPAEIAALVGFVLAAAGALWLTLRLPRGARGMDVRRLATGLGVFAFPWLALLAISLVSTPYLRTTYLAPTAVGVAIVTGAVVARAVGHGESTSAPQSDRVVRAVLAAVVAVPVILGAVASAVIAAQPWRVDDFPGLADRITTVAEPGDGLMVVQLYNEVGVAGAVARELGDAAWVEQLQAQLPDGDQPRYNARTLDGAVPFTTTAGDAAERAVWVVYTRGALSEDELADLPAADVGCENDGRLTDTESFGLMRLSRVACD